MSSSADRARATAARFTAPGEQATPEPVRRPIARTKRVRRTVDLPVARHHALKEWCQGTAVQIGAADVTGQDVLNELVHLLLTDETTARKVRAELEKRLDEQ